MTAHVEVTTGVGEFLRGLDSTNSVPVLLQCFVDGNGEETVRNLLHVLLPTRHDLAIGLAWVSTTTGVCRTLAIPSEDVPAEYLLEKLAAISHYARRHAFARYAAAKARLN